MPDEALTRESPQTRATLFEEIVHRRETQVLRTAYRMLGSWADAEDVAQEVFFRLHRHGTNFSNDADLQSWLYRVAVNLCLDRIRSTRPFRELPDLPSGDRSVETVLCAEQRKQRLLTAIGQLPPHERAAVVLREIEGLTTAEVAAILGSAEGTVRSQVAKAISRLRSILTGEDL